MHGPATDNTQAVAARPILEVLRIAAPTVATMTSYTVMQFVDKFLVSRIGPEPIYVGAQGNGGLAAFVPIAIAMGGLTVVNTYVSQNQGAGKPERAPAYAWNAIWLALAFWLVLLVPYAFVLPNVFALAKVPPEQIGLATSYGQIVVLGSCLTMCTRAVAQFFYGMHRAGIVMVAGVVANILNLVLNCTLIFGPGPAAPDLGAFGQACQWIAQTLHLPRMGIAGSAWGTVIATLVELAIPMALFLGPKYNRLYRTRAAWRPSLKHLRDILRLGWSSGLMFGNEMVCWSYFMVHLVSQFGPRHSTAGWIAHQYMSMSFMPAVGISVACTAMVGKYQGMRRSDLAASRAWLCLRLAMVYMGICGVLFLLFPRALVGLFVQDGTPPADRAELLRLGAMFLLATATFQLFDAMAMTMSGALRGAGDAVVPGIVTVVLSWTLIVLGGEAAIRLFPGLGSLGPWLGASSYIIALAIFFTWRFASGRWKSIKLVDTGPPVEGIADGIGPQAEIALDPGKPG